RELANTLEDSRAANFPDSRRDDARLDVFFEERLAHRRHAETPHDRKRRIAVEEIGADALSDPRLVTLDVEHIVDHLEGNADRTTALVHLFRSLDRETREVACDARADRKERGRLACDDLEIVFERDRRVSPETALH